MVDELGNMPAKFRKMTLSSWEVLVRNTHASASATKAKAKGVANERQASSPRLGPPRTACFRPVGLCQPGPHGKLL